MSLGWDRRGSTSSSRPTPLDEEDEDDDTDADEELRLWMPVGYSPNHVHLTARSAFTPFL